MAQTVLSVVVEVQPASAEVLRSLITALSAEEAALRAAVPLLHFMSMTVFADPAYDPVFVLEANFDGKPGPFWAQLEAAIGPQLRDMLRCAKPPADGAGDLFTAVTALGSRAPIAPLLEACTITPAVFHQGNRGLDRDRIECEAALFVALRPMADDPALRVQQPDAIHAKLREQLLPSFPWLTQTAPPRVGAVESAADWARLIAFGVVAIGALCLPGVLLGLVFKTLLLPVFLSLVAITFWLRIRDLGSVEGRVSAGTGLAALAALVVVGVETLNPFPGLTRSLAAGPHPLLFWATVLASGAVATGLGLLVWLRRLERADPSQDDPPLDQKILDQIARAEDVSVQNHMISIVHIKPGVLRAVLIRAGLWGLGYFLRVTARDGYLASMRTIHFAHWGLISNGGRLMFHSNFDGSWESYLDDFIEKANAGLTLAWTNGVGFPRTEFLINQGAVRGRLFKAWARHSMAPSQLWFHAYDTLTVNQIERQARLADGLRKPSLSPQEAATWLLDL